jgi:asparaginyl-tRNA synthetase
VHRIKDILSAGTGNQNGQQVTVKGWVKNSRKMKELVFVDINDGSCSQSLQVVLEKDKFPKVAYGVSVDVNGVLAQTPKGQIELRSGSCKVIGKTK